MDARAGNTATPDGTWTAWQTSIASGGSISGLAGNRYIQYRANFSTTNPTITPTLDSVTINYNQYATSGNLTSSAYDAGNAANLVARLTWLATGTSTTEAVKFQVRSSPDGTTWSAWCGYADCSGSTYFTDGAGGNGVDIPSNHPLRSGGDDRYFQYKAFLTSGGGAAPTLTSVAVKYVVNAPPDFDPTYGTNGVVVSEVATSTDPGYGKVSISYSVRDVDTSTGTINPGYITPSFEYSTDGGSSWAAIPTGNLQASDITNKFVGQSSYATYTALWTASSTLPSVYNATVKVRVTANDNEAANNTATAVSAAMTLDTKPPTVSAILDSSTGGAAAGTLVLSATDDSQLQYRFCNDPAFPSTDSQGNSCAWSALGGNLASSTVAWIPTGSPNAETAYVQVRDAYDNVNSTPTSMTALATPTNLLAADISNPTANSFGETLSWLTVSGAARYNIYYAATASPSTVPSSYALLTTSTSNVYTHSITTATTSAYWYRVAAVSANGDISNLTTEMTSGDVPDSFGTAAPDTTPPAISAIAVPTASLKSTSAAITFTTNELAAAQVYYGTTHDASCNYGSSTTLSTSYVTAQSVSISGLTPSTTYYFCVKATDVVGNASAKTDGGSFVTAGGPAITSVTSTGTDGTSTTISWNTSTSSDSYVYYSTSSSLASPLTKGTATLVTTASSPGVFQHQVGLTGLTSGTRYYYSVKSTDSDGNSSTDTNAGLYYNFVTTVDTTPPTISGIDTPVKSATAAVIVWQTDEPATTQVTWGTATGALTRTTVLDSTKSVYHIVTLSSQTLDTTGASQALTASTPYYYRIFSADAAGNMGSSTEQTFTSAADGQVTIIGGSPTVSYANGADGAAADTTPPVILSVGTSNVKAFNADINVSTDKATIVSAMYGESQACGSSAGENAFSFSTTKVIHLTNLTEGTTYHYLVKAVDKFGNIGASDDKTFQTPFISESLDNLTTLTKASDVQGKLEQLIESALPSLAPPFIATPVVSSTTENSATVTWKTNIKTYGSLRYATDDEYLANGNDYATEISSGQTTDTTHAVTMTNLLPNTLYHLQARAYVFPQVVGTTPDMTFSTKASPITANIISVTNNGFTVVWQTDGPTSSAVEYRNLKTGESNITTDDTQSVYHSVQVKNLPAGTSYVVSVSGVNKDGNRVESASSLRVTTSVDVTPPVISNFKVDNALVPGGAGFIQTVVGWQTNELANSAVYYEEGAGTSASTTKELANKVESPDVYTTSHIMILANLKAGTVYRLKVVSTDQSGNTKVFGPTSIITPNQSQSVLDIIVKNFEDTFKFLGAK